MRMKISVKVECDDDCHLRVHISDMPDASYKNGDSFELTGDYSSRMSMYLVQDEGTEAEDVNADPEDKSNFNSETDDAKV